VSQEHEFVLLHYVLSPPASGYDDPRYDALKPPHQQAAPQPTSTGYSAWTATGQPERHHSSRLKPPDPARCRRRALQRDQHGSRHPDDRSGIEKLWEFVADGHDGFGASLLAQLLHMAAERARLLGYTIDDLTEFLHTATATPPTP
jgi:hypothetical protein